ncbi:tRNA (guanosine(37)-N1)-methyltransferase TrmD [uncultured Desulfovibrio sp.]|uniref:tRNA (guanosine(37)-N1)-methyltransferase TrmD n=1 Tax=uncultured Desulfovibrio sp. TaxID=167968 RepID=UPI002603CD61|nr:tRNA (guanosine(37)-N1)-methyltransferase TrmD [uncultured Desulfovibrio sp.]
MPRFHIVTLFPEFFHSPLEAGLMGRAREAGIVSCTLHDPRTFSTSRHHHVDDRPYGGGPGMVMQGEPVAAALRSIASPGRMLLMSPGGRPLTQALARELAREDDLTLICGRYEGLDARLNDLFPLEAVSVGEAVLNGGETAALAVLEAVARLVPGYMGKEASGDEESFSHGLLEYPHYTRPEVLEGLPVPDVLRSGDHGRIARWRREESLRATLLHRPDLLDTAPLDREDAAALASMPRPRAGRNLSFCLVHHPVLLDGKKSGTSSLTNLDIHDIARVSRSYATGPFYVVTPLEEQQALLGAILRHWTGGRNDTDRARALDMVRPALSLDDALAQLEERSGTRPVLLASSAAWPGKKCRLPLLTPRDARDLCSNGPVMLCLGTARGLAAEVLARCDGIMRPIRFLSDNHLSVRSAAAILADRILGDYH